MRRLVGGVFAWALIGIACSALVPPQYTLTLDPPVHGKVAGAAAQQKFASSTVVSLTATPDAGYEVGNWSGTDDDTNVTTVAKFAMVADREVSVTFVPVGIARYSLTLSAGSNGAVSSQPTGPRFPSGTVLTLTALPDASYVIGQWLGSDDDTSMFGTNHVTMNADKTVSVSFATAATGSTGPTGPTGGSGPSGVSGPPLPTGYALTLSAGSGGTASAAPSGPVYGAGTVVALTAVPSTGFALQTWSGTDNDAASTLSNTVTMLGNRTVDVSFQPLPYMLTLNAGANGTLASVPVGPVVRYGDHVALTASPITDNVVNAWLGTDNDASASPRNSVTITGDTTVSVTFKPGYTLTLLTPANGALSSTGPTSGPTYDPSTVVNLIASPTVVPGMPSNSYKLLVSGWHGTDNDAATTLTNTVTMTSNRTVYVNFGPVCDGSTYTLSAAVMPVGIPESIGLAPSTPGNMYTACAVVTVTATATPPPTFISWTGTDEASSALVNHVTMLGNTSITATYTP